MSDKLKIELGGGTKPREGFLNIDCRRDLGRVDVCLDLERIGPPEIPEHANEYLGKFPKETWVSQWSRINVCGEFLPFDNETVDEVFSSHCLEHVQNLDGVLHELARVCCNGATITIHVPHYLHPDAMCPSHKHTIGENSVKGWTKREFGQKRFDLVTVTLVPSEHFSEAKELHPGWKDDQIMRFVPGACIEVRYVLRVRRESK